MNLYLLNQVRLPFVHVLDEWAKVAQQDRSDLPAFHPGRRSSGYGKEPVVIGVA